MPETESLCIFEKREPHTAIIRLNRPEKKNAISRDLYWALDGTRPKMMTTCGPSFLREAAMPSAWAAT